MLSCLCPSPDCFCHNLDIIWDLRNQDNIRSSCNSCMKRHPANFVTHHLDNEDSAVGCSSCMNTVDGICRNVYRTLESERHIRSPQIIIDRLWKCNDIQPFLPQKIRRLMRPVSSKDHKAIQVQLMVSVLHRFHFIQSLLIRNPHEFKWLSRCPKDRSTHREDPRKIFRSQHLKISIDQSFIAFFKAINLHVLDL